MSTSHPNSSLDRARRWNAITCAALLAAACGQSEPTTPPTAGLIGTWVQDAGDDPTQGEVQQPKLTFGDDGTLLMELHMPDHVVRDTFHWKFEGDNAGLLTLAVKHEPDDRKETMFLRLVGTDELKVEGKKPATFRRKQ